VLGFVVWVAAEPYLSQTGDNFFFQLEQSTSHSLGEMPLEAYLYVTSMVQAVYTLRCLMYFLLYYISFKTLKILPNPV
jgi:hypothetical protein